MPNLDGHDDSRPVSEIPSTNRPAPVTVLFAEEQRLVALDAALDSVLSGKPLRRFHMPDAPLKIEIVDEEAA